MIVSETFTIEDCSLYASLTTSIDNHIINNGVSYEYTNDGLSITAGNWKAFWINIQLSPSVQFEFDITGISGSPSPQFFCGFSSTTTGENTLTEHRTGDTGHVKIIYQNNTVQWWLDDVLQTIYSTGTTSATVTTDPVYTRFWTGGTRKFKMKNLKIKKL